MRFASRRFFMLLPVLALILVLFSSAAMATETTFDKENFKGLVLTTTVDTISVKLYNGYADNAPEITPVYTEGNDRYYEVVLGGRYKYVAKPASGYSHYNIRKNLYITEEKANTKYVLDVTPPVRTTAGWDPYEQIEMYSDEAMAAAFPSSPDLWPEYAHLFTTPLFNEGRTPHRQTTQTEMMSYINGLNGADDNMYVYILGKSAGAKASEQFEIPVVFFTKTDLSGASTWEEAAELLRANGKLTFMYQAQIHSKEPGNGEAALAMLMDFDGAYGEGLLDNMNLCIIPRFNTWGAYKSKRTVYLGGSELDANRDFMRLESAEVQLRNKLYNAVEPEVYYDSHECNLHAEYAQISMRDVWISTNFTTKATQAYKDTALTVCYEIFDRAEENNLTYGWYSSSINGYNPSMSTTNVAMRGSLVFLNESHGIYGGMQQIERRIMSHVSVVTAILDYINENTAAVQKVVDDQRADIVERGKTYEESDVIVLKSDYSLHPEHYINGKQVDTGSGEITDYVHQGRIYDVVKRSRTAPTAYVIPAGESWNKAVLEKLDLHGISYYQIPEGSVVQLQQYTGNTTTAALTAQTAVEFPKGAYVMTMAQEDSYILAILMEPDVDDLREYEGTFAQQGLITAVDGKYPIYRYIQDLNADNTIDYLGEIPDGPEGLETQGATAMGGMGKITGLDATKLYEYRLESGTAYTAVPAGATEISVTPGKYAVRYAAQADTLAGRDAWYTVGYENLPECVVYLDGTAGSDDLDGYTQTAAVKTFEAAFRQLDFLSAYAAEGAVYQIVITGNVTITQTVYTLPSHTYPVVITGKTDDVGIIHNSDISETRCFNMGGDTTLENITLNLVTRYVSNFLCAAGHKLVIESTVKTIANEDGEYFNFMGGSYGSATETTDVAILGGTWRNVYLGSYKQTVRSNVRGRLANCTVNWVTPSYSGSSGDVYMELEDVTILDGLYCGNVQKGNVNGNVTVTLREGVTFGCFYAGSQTAGNVTGTVTVTVDGADLTGMHLTGKAMNNTGTVGKSVLVYKSGKLGTHSDFTEFADESVKVIRGDLNNDGNVSDADAMYLLRYTLFGDTRYPLNQGGDVNGDGNISDADAMYLLRFTLFGDSRYPLH